MTGARSLPTLVKAYLRRVSFTLSVTVIEAALAAFYPLLIGSAINDQLGDDYTGLIHLALLGSSRPS